MSEWHDRYFFGTMTISSTKRIKCYPKSDHCKWILGTIWYNSGFSTWTTPTGFAANFVPRAKILVSHVPNHEQPLRVRGLGYQIEIDTWENHTIPLGSPTTIFRTITILVGNISSSKRNHNQSWNGGWHPGILDLLMVQNPASSERMYETLKNNLE